MITLDCSHLVVGFIIVVSISAFMHIRTRKISKTYENYKDAKDKELEIIADKILESSENTLNLFFKFESGLVENIRLSRLIKDMEVKSEHLHSEIIILLEHLKAR